MVRLFRHSEEIRMSSENAEKYGPEKLQIRTLFTQCMLHHGSAGWVLSKECYFNGTCFFGTFLLFVIFVSLLDELSNFRSRILTFEKPELVIRNCQWNYM